MDERKILLKNEIKDRFRYKIYLISLNDSTDRRLIYIFLFDYFLILFSIIQKMKRLSQIIIEIIEIEGGLYALEVYRKC